MPRLLQQAVLHLGARLGSVGLSFLLFAWIGRVLPADDVARAYFFSFALGFGLATARMCLQLGAAVDGQARAAQRSREARRGLWILRRLLPLLTLGIGVVTWGYTRQPMLVLASMVVAVLAAPDVDLLRSIVGRSSLFSFAFAIGSLMALALLHWVLPHSLNGVVVALLAQWLPVCVFNMPALRRMLWRRRHLSPGLGLATGTLALASFDGLVLNAPFLGWLKLATPASLDLALAMRVFVASLPMLPLLLHWTNSPAFDQMCARLRMSTQAGFLAGMLLSGLAAGGTFLGVYVWVARQAIGTQVIGYCVLLLLAYSLFAPQMRFAGKHLGTAQRLHKLGIAVLLYLIALVALAAWGQQQALGIVVLQSLTLSGAGWLLARGAKRSNAAIREIPS